MISLRSLIILTALLSSFSSLAAERMTGWDPRFYRFVLGSGIGTNAIPAAVVPTDSGGFLVAGRFTNIQNSALLNLALWDGTSWQQPLLENKSAISLDTTNPEDTKRGIFALATRGPEIFLGGIGITNAGGTSVTNIAWWNGNVWSDMNGGTTGKISALVIDGPLLYAAGQFQWIGGVQASNIAVWTDGRWEALGQGLPFVPDVLATHNGGLFAAGEKGPNRLLRWNGTTWESLANAFPEGESGRPLSLVEATPDTWLNSPPTYKPSGWESNVALWNGSGWHPLASGIGTAFGRYGGRIHTLTTWRDQVLAAGVTRSTTFFEGLGPAIWDGSQWRTVQDWPVDLILKLAAAGDRLFALGRVDSGALVQDYSAAYFEYLRA
jgi:hypothetical protein